MLASTGLGSCIVLAVAIGYLIHIAAPAKKKPAAATAGQTENLEK